MVTKPQEGRFPTGNAVNCCRLSALATEHDTPGAKWALYSPFFFFDSSPSIVATGRTLGNPNNVHHSRGGGARMYTPAPAASQGKTTLGRAHAPVLNGRWRPALLADLDRPEVTGWSRNI
jgi:hypothetical protein